MIKELNHIGLLTASIEVSKDFYTGVLGGTIIRDHKDAEGSLFTYIQLALGVIELIRVAADNPNAGFAHVAYLIDDEKTLDEYYQYLVEKGYEFTLAPKPTTAGDGRLAFFNDKSGTSFELIERKENIRIRDLVNERIEAFKYTAIYAPPAAIPECDTFYTQEMGFSLTEPNQYAIGADVIKLIPTEDETLLKKPLSHICFKVKNCKETLDYLMEQDIKCSEISICEEAGQYFIIEGPSGEQVVFVQ